MYRQDQDICWNRILPFVITIFYKATALLFCECLCSHIFWAICSSQSFLLKLFQFCNGAEEQQLAQWACFMAHIPVKKKRQFYLALKCVKKEKKVSFPGWCPSCLRISGFLSLQSSRQSHMNDSAPSGFRLMMQVMFPQCVDFLANLLLLWAVHLSSPKTNACLFSYWNTMQADIRLKAVSRSID